MDFRQFLTWSDEAHRNAPTADRYCETRISRSFAHLKPVISSFAPPREIHRCDLVRLWCRSKGLPPTARTALASEGVRQSLRVIFSILGRNNSKIAIPADVYPAYWHLAQQAQLPTIAFDTFPNFDLTQILDDATQAGTRHVLLPQPLKLHGRTWTQEEAACADEWLRSDGRRRIILDLVYSFGAPLDCVTRRLLATDQVLLLDSLSKGWLHEQVFGVALVPEQDVPIYTSGFRNLCPSPMKLSTAHELLGRHADVPRRVARETDVRRAALLERASKTGRRTLWAERGYLVAVQCSSQELLADHSLLAIPASVFGSRLANWSVASALPTVE